MAAPFENLHPDDVLFFNDVVQGMRRIAQQYKLPLRQVVPAKMPLAGMIDFMGRCSSTGDIEMVLRCTVDGEWCSEPLSPSKVWETAAHELAHLRHFNHGGAFEEFCAELVKAFDLDTEDHREKVLRRLVKMQAQRDGEAKLGNSEAAEAFASAINRMLIEHELNPSDIDYARSADDDPVIEVMVDLGKYGIDPSNARSAWQESLARTVAKAHLCTYLLRKGTNLIWFVGTRSHATVAEYVYGTLVPAAEKMSIAARLQHNRQVEKEAQRTGDTNWRMRIRGFREAWLDAFIQRIMERFEESRKASVKAITLDMPGGESQALMRLDGALAKVRTYVDNKFKGRKGSATALRSGRSDHAAGRAWGRAAADKMTIGRKGITSGVKGLLK